MDTKKYYTPEIEELHIGFEYERYTETSTILSWQRRILDYEDFIAILDEEKNDWCEHNIRVKYLDKEDIESFGFSEIRGDQRNFFGEVGFDFFKEIKHCMYHLVYHNYKDDKFDMDHHLIIEIHNSTTMKTGENAIIFNGNIRNKSEFTKLLKQVHVYESM